MNGRSSLMHNSNQNTSRTRVAMLPLASRFVDCDHSLSLSSRLLPVICIPHNLSICKHLLIYKFCRRSCSFRYDYTLCYLPNRAVIPACVLILVPPHRSHIIPRLICPFLSGVRSISLGFYDTIQMLPVTGITYLGTPTPSNLRPICQSKYLLSQLFAHLYHWVMGPRRLRAPRTFAIRSLYGPHIPHCRLFPRIVASCQSWLVLRKPSITLI